jgi:hypothetical protein
MRTVVSRVPTVPEREALAQPDSISLYERAGFVRTGEADKLPSDPAQQEIRMLRRTQGPA